MKTDREKLIEMLDMNCGYVSEMKAEQLADHLISQGVSIPVRCAECKHWCEPRFCILTERKYGDCIKPLGAYEDGIETYEDDFCAYGERKEDVPDTKDGKYSEKPNSWKDRMLRTFLGRDR